MKILCISNYYPPFYEGGYEISVKDTMDYLAKKGHEIYILCGIKGVSAVEDVNPNYLPMEAKRILRYLNYATGSFWDKHRVEKYNYNVVKQAIETLKPDLVYMGNMKALSIAPIIAVQDSGTKRVYDLGDIWLKAYMGTGIKSRVFRMLKQALPFTIGGKIELNPVIVLSKWMQKVVSSEYGSKDVFVVPRGIAISRELPREPDHPLKYIFAGRIEPNKGLDLCIKAMHLLRLSKSGENIKIDVYGEEDESYGTVCRDLIKEYNLVDCFRFMGMSTSLNDLMPAYDVFLMPTMAQEAFGRVVIEAMSHKLIVIATAAYGPAEIINHGVDGYLFERGNYAAMAKLIQYLESLDTSNLLMIGERARQTVIDRYELSFVKQQVEDILEKITN